MSRVFVVTGANQGIGFETVRRLARKEGLHTILTSRNAERGQEALKKLQDEFPKASLEVMELDLDSDESQESFIKALQGQHGVIHCLINNAGMAFNSKSKETFEEQAEPTLKTNLFQTAKFTERMIPFLQKDPEARIVTVASMVSNMAFDKCSKEIQERITKEDLKPVEIFDIAEDFLNAVREGKVEERGFPTNNYGMSKLCIREYFRIFARDHPEFIVNTCCPGWCSTRMGGSSATRTPEDGSEVVAYLATEDLGGKSGEFWQDCKAQPRLSPNK